MVSPFDLSQSLPVGGGLLVLCSLAGPPVVKQLMQMVTMVPGQGGRFQCASPNTYIILKVYNISKIFELLGGRFWVFKLGHIIYSYI